MPKALGERRNLEWMKTEKPYITKRRVVIDRFYNKNFGDDRLCGCGHAYYRHFDTYEEMYPCGCKYCDCRTWHPTQTLEDIQREEEHEKRIKKWQEEERLKQNENTHSS